jgi:hypothetical protein
MLLCICRGMVFTPLSTLFQLYCGGQFIMVEKPEYQEKTTNSFSGCLGSLMVQFWCYLFSILQGVGLNFSYSFHMTNAKEDDLLRHEFSADEFCKIYFKWNEKKHYHTIGTVQQSSHHRNSSTIQSITLTQLSHHRKWCDNCVRVMDWVVELFRWCDNCVRVMDWVVELFRWCDNCVRVMDWVVELFRWCDNCVRVMDWVVELFRWCDNCVRVMDWVV